MFINVETQEWPISEHASRTSNLNISFTAEFVPPYPFMQVKATIPSKTFNRVTHTIEQSTPECVDGEYFQTWKVVPKYKTKEEEDEAVASHLKSVVEGKLASIDKSIKSLNKKTTNNNAMFLLVNGNALSVYGKGSRFDMLYSVFGFLVTGQIKSG